MLWLIPYLFLWHRNKCSSFFDITCHMQYICVSWIILFGLLLAIFPTGTFVYLLKSWWVWYAVDAVQFSKRRKNNFFAWVLSWYAVIVLLWLLHQKGFFDPLSDWEADQSVGDRKNNLNLKHRKGIKRSHARQLEEEYGMHHGVTSHPSYMQKKRRSSSSLTQHHALQRHDNPVLAPNDHHQHKQSGNQHAHKERHRPHSHKNRRGNSQGYKHSRDGPLSREIGTGRDAQKLIVKYEEKQPGRRHSKHQFRDDQHGYKWFVLMNWTLPMLFSLVLDCLCCFH